MTKRSGKLSRKKMKLQHYGILSKQIFILGQKKKKRHTTTTHCGSQACVVAAVV